MPSLLQRSLSSLVCGYLRRSPIQRGKWRLLGWASSFLVVELEPGTYLRVGAPVESVEKGLAYRGLLEADDLCFFLSLLSPGMTVLDVGANVGMYALLAARRVGPTGRVLAFEPTPHVADKLRHNLALNGLGNTEVVQAAASDAAGRVTFFLQDDSDLNTMSARAGRPIAVEAVTLDAALSARGIAEVDALKMDVEGAEVRALRGAAGLLASDAAPLLMVEFNAATLTASGSSVGELRGLIEGHGYRCHALGSYAGHAYDNVLALKPRHFERFPGLRGRPLVPLT